ncbi:hypothetical protein SAMN05444920_101685 [Nonomuraea solani]|uniref:Uncharacterized protein n=1 Tax=Nonomuraea solani TaxID=1144553 RepID=A0A1H5UX33_9ACTN|nr:hypothetical protein SAMN05444920_101685 [Nonomuraea solani]
MERVNAPFEWAMAILVGSFFLATWSVSWIFAVWGAVWSAPGTRVRAAVR